MERDVATEALVEQIAGRHRVGAVADLVRQRRVAVLKQRANIRHQSSHTESAHDVNTILPCRATSRDVTKSQYSIVSVVKLVRL